MSTRLLDNRYFDKLSVNRLEAQAIRSDNIQPAFENISYLFSVLLENATFQRNNTGGTLTFDLNVENNNVIQFSDRPFRQTQNISITDFINLFTLGGSDSFEKDPPNMVLVHNEEQRTYIMKLSSQSNNQVVFTLELLPGETHNLTNITGRMNLFVDNTQINLIDTERENYTFSDEGGNLTVRNNITGTLTISSNNVTVNIQNFNIQNVNINNLIINGNNVTVNIQNVNINTLSINGSNFTLIGEGNCTIYTLLNNKPNTTIKYNIYINLLINNSLNLNIYTIKNIENYIGQSSPDNANSDDTTKNPISMIHNGPGKINNILLSNFSRIMLNNRNHTTTSINMKNFSSVVINGNYTIYYTNLINYTIDKDANVELIKINE